MRSVRAAAIAALVLALGAAIAAVIAKQMVDTFHTSGQLDLTERILLASSNWYVRFLPFLTLAVVGAAAVVTGIRGEPATIGALRRERYAWAAFALVSLATEYCVIAALQHGLGVWWSLAVSVAGASFVVAFAGVIIATARIHRHGRTLEVA